MSNWIAVIIAGLALLSSGASYIKKKGADDVKLLTKIEKLETKVQRLNSCQICIDDKNFPLNSCKPFNEWTDWTNNGRERTGDGTAKRVMFKCK